MQHDRALIQKSGIHRPGIQKSEIQKSGIHRPGMQGLGIQELGIQEPSVKRPAQRSAVPHQGTALVSGWISRWISGCMAVLLVLLLVLGKAAPVWAQTRALEAAIAQSESTAPPALNTPSPTFNSMWEKLDRIREDRQLQQLVEDDLEKSFVIRAQIQAEVDRAFSHTTALINVMLALLTSIPVLAAVGIWFIRRSVIGQITQETKQQLAEEVEKQFDRDIASELKQQGAAFKQELEQLRAELVEQLAQVKGQVTSLANSESLNSEAVVVQDLEQASLLPITRRVPPVAPVEETAMATATTYVKQGNALYLESALEDAISLYDKALQLEPDNAQAWFRKGATLAKLQQWSDAIAAYDTALQHQPNFPDAWFAKGSAWMRLAQLSEAIAAYDTAVQLKPDFFLGWLGKARCHALQGQVEDMVVNLQQARILNAEKCRDILRVDAAFEGVRLHPQFQTFVEE